MQSREIITKIADVSNYISRICSLYSPPYFYLCLGLLLLLSCQQVRFKEARDYSGLLPDKQLLYANISVFPHKQLNAFPYADITEAILEQPQLRKLLERRLVRVQLALGADHSLFAVAQLQLPQELFHQQLSKQADWQPVFQPNSQPGGFAHRSTPIALEMPSSNVLFYWQGTSTQGNPAGLEPFQQSHQAWSRGSFRAENWPTEIADLQDRYPIVLYSPMPLQLLLNPLIQRAFPAISGTFHNIDPNFILDYMLLWIGPLEVETGNSAAQSEGQAAQLPKRSQEGAIYLLHMKVQAGNPIVAKSLETAVRLVLPGLLFRSKQPFIRQQLPYAQIRSEGSTLLFSLPLDRAAVSGILSSLPLSSPVLSRRSDP